MNDFITLRGSDDGANPVHAREQGSVVDGDADENGVHWLIPRRHERVDDARHEHGGGRGRAVHGHVHGHGALIGATKRQTP